AGAPQELADEPDQDRLGDPRGDEGYVAAPGGGALLYVGGWASEKTSSALVTVFARANQRRSVDGSTQDSTRARASSVQAIPRTSRMARIPSCKPAARAWSAWSCACWALVDRFSIMP